MQRSPMLIAAPLASRGSQLTYSHGQSPSLCLLSSPLPSLLCSQSSCLSLHPSFPASLCSEVGHSGSPVYSSAAASGERASEGARGKHRRVEEKQQAYFNIPANPHQRGATRTSAFALLIPAAVHIWIYDREFACGPQILHFINL